MLWPLSVPVCATRTTKTLSKLAHIRSNPNIQDSNEKRLEKTGNPELKWSNQTLTLTLKKIKIWTPQSLIRSSTKLICWQPKASRHSTTQSLVSTTKKDMTVSKTASRSMFKTVNIREQSMVDQTMSQWSRQPLEFISQYMTILDYSQSKWLRQ